MSIVSDKDWHELPGPVAAAKLVEFRNELREKNLHDTEEPPLETSTAPAAGEGRNARTSDGTYNDLDLSAHGQRGHAVRAQRPAERDVPRYRQSHDAEPAPRQPGAADAHDIPAGHDPQRDRRGVDPVHGARLVRAQEGRLDAHARHPGGRWRRLARAADARAEDTGGSAEGRRVHEAAGLHQREHPLVGRLAGVWQHARQPGVAPRRTRRQGARQPERAARGGSGHRAARSPASPRTAGSV